MRRAPPAFPDRKHPCAGKYCRQQFNLRCRISHPLHLRPLYQSPTARLHSWRRETKLFTASGYGRLCCSSPLLARDVTVSRAAMASFASSFRRLRLRPASNYALNSLPVRRRSAVAALPLRSVVTTCAHTDCSPPRACASSVCPISTMPISRSKLFLQSKSVSRFQCGQRRKPCASSIINTCLLPAFCAFNQRVVDLAEPRFRAALGRRVLGDTAFQHRFGNVHRFQRLPFWSLLPSPIHTVQSKSQACFRG